MRFRLQVAVAFSFTLLTVAILGVVVWTFFQNNRALGLETARTEMRQAQARTAEALDAFAAPAARAVDNAVRLIAAMPEAARSQEGFAAIAALVGDLPQVSGIFFGEVETGAFWQFERIAPGTGEFGPQAVPVPAGAAGLMRFLTRPGDGTGEDRITFLSADGTELGTVIAPATFDPRRRPWFEAALGSDSVVVSPVYAFAGTGRPGVTYSRRIAGADGRTVAVAGIDVSLDNVAQVLAEVRVDGVGEVFLIDPAGRLAATSETAAGGKGELTAAAVAAMAGRDPAGFRFVLPGSESGYLVAASRIETALGSRPTLGVVVPERHFVGAIIDATRHVILVSGLVLVVAVLLTAVLARLVGASLRIVTDEARRISTFDLSGRMVLNSRISEVQDLGSAMAGLRNSLESFGAYVPKEVVRSIVASGGRVEVGGTAREVTLLFSDIEGFTSRSEGLAPETAMTGLSRYFSAMARVIEANGGTIDKYIGDAVMALWNAPLDQPGHAALACRAALGCQAAEARLNAEPRSGETIFPTRTRFGLHCDRVVVGNVGAPDRLQYTAIGGAVNLGSRIEGLNKVYGTGILASRPVVDRAGAGFLFRPVDLVMPAGTSRPVELFELAGGAEAPDALQREVADWSAALALYRARDWPGAAAAMGALRASGAACERLIALYLGRCAAFAAHPPPPDWSGAHAIDRK